METNSNPLRELRQRFTSGGKEFSFYSLPALGQQLNRPVARLPVCLRIVLESLLRNCDGKRVSEQDVQQLVNWNAQAPAPTEIPFTVARILLQDFTGVPLLVDLAAMRTAAARLQRDPKIIEPLVPVELVVDHSVQVDFFGTPSALAKNIEMEMKRNRERYEFLKWGQGAFESFKVIPPGIGIVHQVNLEHLARGVMTKDQSDGVPLAYPDTLVGTDSHTTMINGLGIVGWGVGGIEAEAGMLGQPIYFLTPEVVGVHLRGRLREGVTATDLVLRITELLRKAKVVGKFVEFHGEGTRSLPLPDRATIGNMCPEYGATIGFFPIDDKTLDYLRLTGRSEEHVTLFKDYLEAQGLFGIPEQGQVEYSTEIDLDLDTVEASVAGPKRPQDRIALSNLHNQFQQLLQSPINEGGYGRTGAPKEVKVDLQSGAASSEGGGGSQEPQEPAQALLKNTSQLTEQEMVNNRPTPDPVEGQSSESLSVPIDLHDGSVVIAAITSCTNTSNPSVMLAAGLLAKNAVLRGLRVNPAVKTSLAPGSRVVSDYFQATGLQEYLDALGFHLVGYGCTTCIGNSGPLPPAIEATLQKHDLVAASVLSGNRNFEARIHALIKANFLMSPPLVVAFALAGRIDIDLLHEPLGTSSKGEPVFLRDIWPSDEQVQAALKRALKPEAFRRLYKDFSGQNPAWNQIPAPTGVLYQWNPDSTYIQEPPFFHNFGLQPPPIGDVLNARILGIFGDSVTTDHISPAGAIKRNSPAGQYLLEKGVSFEDFNSYGARRGNDRIMTRGTFANVRIRNLMLSGIEGGFTRNYLANSADPVPIFDAAQAYAKENIPLIVMAGKEYGTGSSRDWAAKGPRLLGVKVVIAETFERIHRSNLIGMGVLPCSFEEGTNATALKLDGSEICSVLGLNADLAPKQQLELQIQRSNGEQFSVPVFARLDTPIEVEYYRHGGILPYMLRQLTA